MQTIYEPQNFKNASSHYDVKINQKNVDICFGGLHIKFCYHIKPI